MDATTIRPVAAGDLDAVCEVIGDAFADNPNSLAIAGGDSAKAARVMRSGARVAKFGRNSSYGLVAEHGDQIVGALNAARWPRCQLGLWEKIKSAPSMVRTMGTALPRTMKLAGIWARNDPKEPHWHIGPVGVVPEFQGQGVGKALLGSFLEAVDEERSMAYLETDVDRNVSLYEQFGFQVIGRTDILGVNNRFMRRAPRPLVS